MDRAQLIYGNKGAQLDRQIQADIDKAIKGDKDIGEKGTLTKQLNLLTTQTPPRDPQKLAKYNEQIDALQQKIDAREQYLIRKHSRGSQSSGSDTVTNVDNLPPRK